MHFPQPVKPVLLKNRYMRGNDSPALGKTHPDLALPARNRFSIHRALEFQRDAAEITAECDDVEPPNCAREICGRTAFAEGLNLLDSVQILSNAEAHRVWRRPEHPRQRFCIIGHERGLVFRVERLQLRDDCGVIYSHGWSELVARTSVCRLLSLQGLTPTN